MNNKAMAAIALTLIIALPICLSYAFNLNVVEEDVFKPTDPTNITNMINNSTQDVYVSYKGLDNNYFMMNDGVKTSLDFVTHGSTYTSIINYENDGTPTWNWVPGSSDYNLPNTGYWTFKVTNSQISSYGYTLNGIAHISSIVETSPAIDLTFERLATGYVLAGDSVPLDATDVYIHTRSNAIYVVIQNLAMDYAYPSAGWHTSATPGETSPYKYRWINNQTNNNIVMTINLAETSVTQIYPIVNGTPIYGRQYIDLEKEAGGNVHIETYDYQGNMIEEGDLGDYQYIRLTIDLEKITIDGIKVWPSMDQIVQSFNRLEMSADFIDHYYFGTGITSIGFVEDAMNTGANVYRIDSALIKSATYPTVDNAVIVPTDIKPNLSNCQVQITKIDIIGDSITFGGSTFNITDRKITVSGHSVNVDNVVLKSTTEDGVTWSHYINDILVSQSAGISSISLGGTWSAIYTLSNLTIEKVKSTEWIAGDFGYDMHWFAIVGLISCAAVTIGLGLYGIRSGVKMLWLMLITGGAAVVFMLMI